MNPTVSVVTIGVADVARSKQFYERLGCRAEQGPDAPVRFQLGPSVLALNEWGALADAAGVSPDSTGFRRCTLSAIFETAAEVDAVVAEAKSGGATITKPTRSALWGGYSGYFADRDGHLWKIASSSKPVRGRDRREREARAVKARGELMRPKSIAVTLGVDDVKRTKQFYADGLGCPVEKSFGNKFVSFDLGECSSTLGLYTRQGLAKDAGVPAEGSGFGGITLCSAVDSPKRVDETLTRAERAGARIEVPTPTTRRGGYSGYFYDPDGNVWRVAAP